MLNVDNLPISRKQARSIAGALRTPQLAVWTGAVASGKTIASLIAFLIMVTRAPKSGLIVMVGRTLQTIERNLIDPLQDERIFGEFAAEVHHTTGSGTAVIFGKTVHLIGASDVRAEGRIRGATIALAYIDEATLIPEPFWVMMLSRLRVPGARLLATTNPANPGHWLRRDYIQRAADVGMRTWHFTLDDNPYLAPEFVARLKRQYQGLWYKRYILGLWIASEGAVFDMFDPDRHVVDVCPVIKRWLCCAVDYGTAAAFAAVLLGLGADRRLYFTAEWYWDSRTRQRQLTDTEYSAKLREWLASVRHPGSQLYGVTPERIIIDPSGLSFIRQLHADRHLFGGIGIVGADNSVLTGIRPSSRRWTR